MSVLAQVPVERIGEASRQMPLSRTLQAIAGGLLYGAGRLAYRLLRGLLTLLGGLLYVGGRLAWSVTTWCVAAVQLGWVDARETDRARRAAREAASS